VTCFPPSMFRTLHGEKTVCPDSPRIGPGTIVMSDRTPTAPRDRRHERTPGLLVGHKPAVLSRGTIRWLCLGTLAVILYGTIGPISLNSGHWFEANPTWRIVPPSTHSDFDDYLTNFIVYLPVGVALRLLIRRRNRAGLTDFTAAVFLAALLSWGTEVIQQFIPGRASSRIDVLVNTISAAVGALGAPWVQRRIRGTHEHVFDAWHTRPWAVLTWTVSAALFVLMLQPFVPGPFQLTLDLFRQPDWIDLRRGGLFAVLGFVAVIANAREHGDLRKGVVLASQWTYGLALALELLQSVIGSHEADVYDMTTGVIGGLAGILAAKHALVANHISLRKESARPLRDVQLAEAVSLVQRIEPYRPFIAIGLLMVVCYMLLPPLFGLSGWHMQLERTEINWLPFRPHFYASFDTVLANVTQSLMAYAFLTLMCLLLSPRWGGRVALLLVMGIVGVGQAVQPIYGKQIDISPFLLAFVAWYGMGHIWRTLIPQASDLVADSKPRRGGELAPASISA
jgi:VanZ family protein